MKRSEVIFGLLRIPMDALAVLAALLLAYRLREANMDLIPGVDLLDVATTLPPFNEYLTSFVLPGMVAFLVLAAGMKLYSLQTLSSAWEELANVIISSLLWLVWIMGWFFLVQKQLFYSRILLIHSVLFITFFVMFSRVAITLLQRAFLRAGIGVRLVVSIGSQPIAWAARDTLARDIRYEYLGHVPNLAGLRTLAQKCVPDLVLQTDASPGSEETSALIDECRSRHIAYAFLPPVLADVPHLLVVERLGLLPMLRFQPTPLDGWGRVGKRLFDITMSGLLLVLLSPLFLVVAVLIYLETGWPIFYKSRRVGEQGRKFLPVLKFRSMVQDADARKAQLLALNHRHDGPLFKIKNDPRVTHVGKWLRTLDIDELPQLLNVFVGHMSLVGPRPHLPEEVDRYTHYQRRVFAVKPGITGLAQISGRSDLKFEEEVRLDLRYVEEWSILLDLWILWRTVWVVLARLRAEEID